MRWPARLPPTGYVMSALLRRYDPKFGMTRTIPKRYGERRLPSHAARQTHREYTCQSSHSYSSRFCLFSALLGVDSTKDGTVIAQSSDSIAITKPLSTNKGLCVSVDSLLLVCFVAAFSLVQDRSIRPVSSRVERSGPNL